MSKKKNKMQGMPLDLLDDNPEITGVALLCPSCNCHIFSSDLLEKVAFAEEKKATITCDMCGKRIAYKIKTSFVNKKREMVITIKRQEK